MNISSINGLGNTVTIGTISIIDTANGRDTVRGGIATVTPNPQNVTSPTIINGTDGLSGVTFGSPVPAGSATINGARGTTRGAYTN
jgi:hypothetical protein